jgi:hypothetical protein
MTKMKSKKSLIEITLEKEPNFRERSRRDKGFIILLVEKYPSLSQVSPQQLLEFGQDFRTYTRTWNRILELREDLQGRDYNDKKILEQEAKIELEYTPGYHKDISKKTKDKIGINEPIELEIPEIDVPLDELKEI